jgi:striatin 1/3/4
MVYEVDHVLTMTIRGSLEEADPSITFRGHTNVVTAVTISASQNRVYSASLDSTIRVWNLPSEDRGPFAPVGKCN